MKNNKTTRQRRPSHHGVKLLPIIGAIAVILGSPLAQADPTLIADTYVNNEFSSTSYGSKEIIKIKAGEDTHTGKGI